MKKRLFEVFDIMNQNDSEKGTKTLSVSTSLVGTNKVRQGAIVQMGVDEETMMNLVTEKSIAILVVVDREEYSKLSKEE